MPHQTPAQRRRLIASAVLLVTPVLGACGRSQPAPAETAATEPPAGDEQMEPGAAEEPTAPAEPKVAPISKAPYGQVDGKDVELYTLTNANGLVLKVTNYGCIITELHVPDRDGKLGDIVHGFDNVDDYVKSSPYFGATIGRVANRIKGAKFKLEGKSYKLAMNNAPSHLHGGKKGWDKVIWTAETSESDSGPSIKLSYVSPDGEEGYPGTVNATTTYTLTNDNELRVEMAATTDKTTIINMAHHTYWNLGGTTSGSIEDHEVTLSADKYTPGMPPTGKVKPVAKSPFDFTVAKPIGRDLKQAGGKPVGFDHNFVVNGDAHTLRPVARVKDPKSGRVMMLEADQPGVQFYTGNFMDGTTQGKGATHTQYSAFCLESQKFPNSINVPAWREEAVLKPDQTYKHTMIHKFTAE
jgi:aldose 1-epimerase